MTYCPVDDILYSRKGKITERRKKMKTNERLTNEEFKKLMELLRKAKNEDDEILEGIQDLIELMRINKAIRNN